MSYYLSYAMNWNIEKNKSNQVLIYHEILQGQNNYTHSYYLNLERKVIKCVLKFEESVCLYCGSHNDYSTENCNKYSIKEKITKLKVEGCFCCLKKENHIARNCNVKAKCK